LLAVVERGHDVHEIIFFKEKVKFNQDEHHSFAYFWIRVIDVLICVRNIISEPIPLSGRRLVFRV
jgi:hypothetical protein